MGGIQKWPKKDGLLYGQEAATKLENRTKPSADDKRMILTMKTMGQAYVQLANKTFKDENNGETFETLDDIKDHLDSKLPGVVHPNVEQKLLKRHILRVFTVSDN
jgi:hypothetical protein